MSNLEFQLPKHLDDASAGAEHAEESVCILTFEILARQAEARLLFAGEGFVTARAKALGVETNAVVCDIALLPLLQQGAKSPDEYALLSALAVRGFGLSTMSSADRFVRCSDWLELNTEYHLYPLVERLAPGKRDEVRLELQGGTLNAAPREVALRALHAAVLSQHWKLSAEPVRIQGHQSSKPASLLSIVTGMALLKGIARLIRWTTRSERQVELVFKPEAFELITTATLFGKVVSRRTRTVRKSDVQALQNLWRKTTVPVWIGTLLFGSAVFASTFLLFDGVRTGETSLLLAATALAAAGAISDIVLHASWMRPSSPSVLSGISFRAKVEPTLWARFRAEDHNKLTNLLATPREPTAAE